MSASRLSTSMMRMGMLARTTPASIAARQALPCTCQSVPSRLQSSTSSSGTTAAGEAAKASTSSSVLRQASMSSFGSSSGTANSARIAQDSFKRQSRARTTLPVIKDQKMLYLGVAAFAITAWTFFVMWAMSAEKAASTVVRTLLFNLRTSPIVKEALGEGVRSKPFLFGGEPWVHGTVNTIQGVVDIHFRVISDSGREGTVYFKSERRTKGSRFETRDFKLVVDGNPMQIVELKNTDLLGLNKE